MVILKIDEGAQRNIGDARNKSLELLGYIWAI